MIYPSYEEAREIVTKAFLSQRICRKKWKRYTVKLVIECGLVLVVAWLMAKQANQWLLFPVLASPILLLIAAALSDMALYYRYRKQVKNGTYFDHISKEKVIRQAEIFCDFAGKIIDEEKLPNQ